MQRTQHRVEQEKHTRSSATTEIARVGGLFTLIEVILGHWC